MLKNAIILSVLSLLQITFLNTRAAFAATDATAVLNSKMPEKTIVLGKASELDVGDAGLTLFVDLGKLKPGWYRISEGNSLQPFVKTVAGLFMDGQETPVRALVGRGKDAGKPNRYFKITTGGDYKYGLILMTREGVLAKFPTRESLGNGWSEYGTPMNESDFTGYPKSGLFLSSLVASGKFKNISIQLNSVREDEVPLNVRDYYSK